MENSIKVMVCGAQGYAGKELVSLVKQHPNLQFVGILDRNSLLDIEIDVLLLATPVESSMELIALHKNKPFKIIDLSGAFRLSSKEFNQWYGIEHTAPELLSDAHYGLSPWNTEQNKHHNLFANPGCYATCALMSLIPLLKNKVIKNIDIIIDAKSGVSGAGKKAKDDLMFCEISENFFPYKIGKHAHIPEINNALSIHANSLCNVSLMTHLLPISRGISMSIYTNAQDGFNSDEEIITAIHKAYEKAYGNYPLVKFGEINGHDSKKDQFLLSLKSVVGTAETHIGYFVKAGKVFVFACIDNLLKGAASQAIENINAIYQWPLETGLL